jgi:hypothetical protein
LGIKQTIKGGLKNFIKLVLILIISVTISEIGLRLYNYFNPTYIFHDAFYNRFRPKPFTELYGFKINSKGFHDLEFNNDKNNAYRILGIGDSFAVGVVPYKYNYLTLLESQLKQLNKNIEVLNMGIAGIGPKDYLSLLVLEGLELEPDMVILSFFIGNDLIESSRFSKPYSYSYLISLIHYFFNIQAKIKGVPQLKQPPKEYCDNCASLDYRKHISLAKIKMTHFVKPNYVVNYNVFLSFLNDALHYISKINDTCNDKDIKFLVVLIPDEIQIDHTYRKEVMNLLYPDMREFHLDLTHPNRILSENLSRLNIEYVDLYDYFVKESQKQRLYRPRDTHWNIAGNQLAANVISKYVSKYLVNSSELSE